MPISNQKLIADSLLLLGVTNETQEPTAEMAQHALRVLNELLEEWRNDGVDLEYFEQDTLAAETPIPAYAVSAVKYYLAFALAPYYSRPVSAEMFALGERMYSKLVRDSVIAQLQPADMSHMHSGTGHNVDFDY